MWVCQLPAEVQKELRDDARLILEDTELGENIEDALDRVMCEKLADIVGYEDGLLSPSKYGKYMS